MLHLQIPQDDTQHVPDSPASSEGSFNSLFDDEGSPFYAQSVASLIPPPISGLYYFPTVMGQHTADDVFDACASHYFRSKLSGDATGSNQVMLFTPSGFHPSLRVLLETLSESLRQLLPNSVYFTLFPETPTLTRQAIINLYLPGEGITPHVDLLTRYADGIIGVSLGAGTVMRFDRVSADPGERHDLYLEERSVLVLTKDARFDYTHGIDGRTTDLVAGPDGTKEERSRGVRISVTFRWMKPRADVVGA